MNTFVLETRHSEHSWDIDYRTSAAHDWACWVPGRHHDELTRPDTTVAPEADQVWAETKSVA